MDERVMTPEEFEQKMRAIRDDEDGSTETDHVKADGLMCDLLRALGYGEGVKVFVDMTKWYA